MEGIIRDDLIPESGRDIACPKCKKTFFVQKEGVPPRSPLPGGAVAELSRGAPAGPLASSPSEPTKKTSPLLIVVMAALFLALGFYAGYQYRGIGGGEAPSPTKSAKPPGAPKHTLSDTTPTYGSTPLMTPMTTPGASIPPGNPDKTSESGSGKTYTAGSLFDTFSAMSKDQVQDFCRKNSTAGVTGDGTIREIKKTKRGGKHHRDLRRQRRLRQRQMGRHRVKNDR